MSSITWSNLAVCAVDRTSVVIDIADFITDRSWWDVELQSAVNTRKLSYHKDDHAMRSMYGRPENCRESLSTPTATFSEILNRFLFQSILWICIQNLKFVALPVPEIIGGTIRKNGQALDTPTLLFKETFNGLLFGWTLWIPAKFELCSFARSQDNSDWRGGVANPSLKEEAVRGDRDGTVWKSADEFL